MSQEVFPAGALDIEDLVSDISSDAAMPKAYASRLWTWPGCSACGCGVMDRVVKDIRVRDQGALPGSVRCSADFLHTLRSVQKIHNNATLRSSLVDRCLTRDIPRDLFRGLEYVVTHPVTLGGMSRIFAVRRGSESFTMKVTDVSRSLGNHEMQGYEFLAENGIPCARVEYHTQVGTFHVTVIERLECTLTTVLLAMAIDGKNDDVLDGVTAGIERLLKLLRRQGLVFVDFTTDNIMCRLTPEGNLEFVLIDPQFVVLTASLTARFGKAYAENLDRVHLCIKLLGISLLKTGKGLRRYAKAVCRDILGYVPATADVARVLSRHVPLAIRAAHDVLEKKSRTLV
jgi:hypothetical protein